MSGQPTSFFPGFVLTNCRYSIKKAAVLLNRANQMQRLDGWIDECAIHKFIVIHGSGSCVTT